MSKALPVDSDQPPLQMSGTVDVGVDGILPLLSRPETAQPEVNQAEMHPSSFLMDGVSLNRLTPKKLARMQTIVMIDCVRKNTALWDSTSPHFYDYRYRQLLWKNIAEVLQMDVNKMKVRWKTLKKTYKKWVESKSSSQPLYAESLQFLTNEIQKEIERSKERAESTNAPPQNIADDPLDGGSIQRGCQTITDSLGEPPDKAASTSGNANVETNSSNTLKETTDVTIPVVTSTTELTFIDAIASTVHRFKIRDINELMKKTILDAPLEKATLAPVKSVPVAKKISKVGKPKQQGSLIEPVHSKAKSSLSVFSTDSASSCAKESTSSSVKPVPVVVSTHTNAQLKAKKTPTQDLASEEVPSSKKTKIRTIDLTCDNESLSGDSENLSPEVIIVDADEASEPAVKRPKRVVEEKAEVKVVEASKCLTLQKIIVNPDGTTKTSTAVADSLKSTAHKSASGVKPAPVPVLKSLDIQSKENTQITIERIPLIADVDPSKAEVKNELNSTDERVESPTKASVDQSANVGFLLSLLPDVETMTNIQFRVLKKHSTHLVSTILDQMR